MYILNIFILTLLDVILSSNLIKEVKIGYSNEMYKEWNNSNRNWIEYDNGHLPNVKSGSSNQYYKLEYNVVIKEEILFYSFEVVYLGELEMSINGNVVFSEDLNHNDSVATTVVKILPYYFKNVNNTLSFITHYIASEETRNPFKIRIEEINSENECEKVSIESVTKVNKDEYLVTLSEISGFNKINLNITDEYSIYGFNNELITPENNCKARKVLKVVIEEEESLTEEKILIQSCKIKICKEGGINVLYERSGRECGKSGELEFHDKSMIGERVLIKINNSMFIVQTFDDSIIEGIAFYNNDEFISVYKVIIPYCIFENIIQEGTFQFETKVSKRTYLQVKVRIDKGFVYDDVLIVNDNFTLSGIYLKNHTIHVKYPETKIYTHLQYYLPIQSFIGELTSFEITSGVPGVEMNSYGLLLINVTESIHKIISYKYYIPETDQSIIKDYELYAIKCPEYTVPFSVEGSSFNMGKNISIQHSGYTILMESSIFRYFSYCSPFKDFKISLLYSRLGSNYNVHIYFNELKKEFDYKVNSENDEKNITEDSFPEVIFKYKLEYSDVEQVNDDWKEYFEGNKWPSYYLGEFPPTNQDKSYYRMIYTNYLPLFDVVEYNITGSVKGKIELYFNGLKLENERQGNQFEYIANQTIIRDGNNYIALTVERNEISDSDDLVIEVIPHADEKNCADSTCSRNFCQDSTEFLKAEVNSFYTVECGYGRNGYKKYKCVEEGGDRIYKLEEHCEKLAEDFEYGNENELIFNSSFTTYSPIFNSERGHGYFALNETLPSGIIFNEVTGEFSGTCYENEMLLNVKMTLIPGVDPLSKDLKIICTCIFLFDI